jgi:hypothetical protein
MKKLFLIILITCSLISNLKADYQDDWVQAVQYCHEKNFDLAEKEFTKSINKLEYNGDFSKPNLYIDRRGF